MFRVSALGFFELFLIEKITMEKKKKADSESLIYQQLNLRMNKSRIKELRKIRFAIPPNTPLAWC